jgi:hypothetical protein
MPCLIIYYKNILIFPLNFILQKIIDKNIYEIFVIFQMLSMFGNEWVKKCNFEFNFTIILYIWNNK